MATSSRTLASPGRLVAFVLLLALVGAVGFTVGRWSVRRDVRNAVHAVERRLKALETRAATPVVVVQTPAVSPVPSTQASEENRATPEPEADGLVAPLFVPVVVPQALAPGPAGPTPESSAAGEADGGLPPSESAEVPEPASAAPPREPEEPRPVSCGASWCSPGLVCCNADCGLCAPPGVTCSQRMCSVVPAPVSVLCGMSTCNVGYVCCNPSCGTCVPAGQTCDPKPCNRNMEFPYSEMCGMTTCNTGYECCNPSCGTCVRPGESCSRAPCGW